MVKAATRLILTAAILFALIARSDAQNVNNGGVGGTGSGGTESVSSSYATVEIPSGYVPTVFANSPTLSVTKSGTFAIVFIGAFLVDSVAGATSDVEISMTEGGTGITGNIDIATLVAGTGTGPPYTQYSVVPIELAGMITVPAAGAIPTLSINMLSSSQPLQVNGGSGIWLLSRAQQ